MRLASLLLLCAGCASPSGGFPESEPTDAAPAARATPEASARAEVRAEAGGAGVGSVPEASPEPEEADTTPTPEASAGPQPIDAGHAVDAVADIPTPAPLLAGCNIYGGPPYATCPNVGAACTDSVCSVSWTSGQGALEGHCSTTETATGTACQTGQACYVFLGGVGSPGTCL
jgi:hypothetical protein